MLKKLIKMVILIWEMSGRKRLDCSGCSAGFLVGCFGVMKMGYTLVPVLC